ncbi:MAG TPA: hypothetical protein VEA69_06005 [Tepidisphaeraceae bacterium]|nr:hypothetical protein [Tepidisphaeraceae bacterium]
MAKLTKQQQAEFDAMIADAERIAEERDIARALAWPNFPKPAPLRRPTPEESGERYIEGWATRTPWSTHDTPRVVKEWQSWDCYFSENPKGKTGYRGGARGGGPLYATEAEAWLAMYHDEAIRYGKQLARMLANAAKAEGRR